MKKYLSFVIIVFLIISCIFQLNVLANEELSSFSIDVDKTIINPNNEVKLTINFGVKLATYSVTIDYDDDLLDFVSVSAGKKTDLDGKIKIENLEDSETESIIVTFKGKEVKIEKY